MGSPEPNSPANRVRIRLEELQIGPLLGKGAGGVVQLAVHVPTGTRMAVKTLNIFEAAHKHEEIIKELRALHVANHENIVKLYEAFYSEGRVVLALEYMDRGSLADMIQKGGAIPEEALASISLHALSALAFLHKVRHIVHRDIKPANILMNSLGQAKIADFGITRELDSSLAAAETFVGSTPYMAPERILAGKHSFSTDVWSLGISILECALGQYPYGKANSFFDLHDNIVNLPSPRPDRLRHSAEFCDFIESCLNKDQAQRPSAADLLQHPFILNQRASTQQIMQWLTTRP